MPKLETEEKRICAFFIGTADNDQKAKQIAESYHNCPYIRVMATKEKQMLAVFFLPKKQRWWIEYVEKKPRETFGLKEAKVIVVDEIQYPKQLKMQLPKKPLEISPCGSSCKSCPAYEKCLCCPATILYKHDPSESKQLRNNLKSHGG